MLFETLRPAPGGTGGGLLPYAGLPDVVIVDAASARSGLTAASRQAGLASVAAETVVDHGKIYLSGHLMAVCERLGISVQPARPLTPTDKAAIERFSARSGKGCCGAARLQRPRRLQPRR